MGNAACSSCCCWWRDAPVDSKKTDGDGKDGDSAWIKQGSVPLVTARYDSDDMDTECVVKKTVVMRSPRPAAGSVSSVAPIPTSLSSRGSSRSKSDDGGGDDRHSTRACHETGGSMSAGLVSDSYDRVHSSPSSHRISSSSPRHHSSSSVSSASSPHRRKKNRAAGLRPLDPPSDDEVKASALAVDDEVETKEREFAAPKDADDSSPLADASEPLDAASQTAARHSDHDSHHRHHHREDSIDQQQDDDADEQQQEEEPPRSPRSTRSASHDSTGSGSTKRKARYGRKNYRANSNRKKTH